MPAKHRLITGYVKLRLPRDGAPNIPLDQVGRMLDGEWEICRRTLLDRIVQIRDFSRKIIQ